MGYYNMIYQYNENKFINQCKKSKVDGLIVVDLPFPENKKFAQNVKIITSTSFNLFHLQRLKNV